MPKTFSVLPQVNKYLQTLKDKVETMTNKTLTAPVITNATITGGTDASKSPVTLASADGAITISPGVVAITKGSAAALTIAAPSTAQNGTIMTIISSTAFAHVVTFTGSTYVNGASSAFNTITFAAYAGSTVRVIAYDGKWYQSGYSNVTPSSV